MYLLDTNICIYLLKNRYPALSDKIMQVHPSELAVSAVTVYELEYGAAKSKWGERTRENLSLFLSGFEIVPFDASDAIAAAQIRAYLEEHGKSIGAYDIQIAAQGVSRGWIVVTHNTGEFCRVSGLTVEDWTMGETKE